MNFEKQKENNYTEERQDLLEKIKETSLDFHLAKYRENPEAFVKNLETDDFLLYKETVRLITWFFENPEAFFEREKLKKEFLQLEKNIAQRRGYFNKLITEFENANEMGVLKKEFQKIADRYSDKKSPEYLKEFLAFLEKQKQLNEKYKYCQAYCGRDLMAYLIGKLYPYIDSFKTSRISEK